MKIAFCINSKYRNIFIIIFLSCLLLPHGTGYYLDGLPFNSLSEIILFTVFLPYIFFYKNFFDYFIIRIIISIIVLFKIILIFSPTNGIAIKQYFVEEKENANFIKTFDTFWNKNYSYVQRFNFKKKDDFPIDWTINDKLNATSDLDEKKLESDLNNKKRINIFNYRKHRFYDRDTFSKLPLDYESNFILIMNNYGKIKIITEGSTTTKILVQDYKIQKNIFNTTNTLLNLPKGFYSIKIKSNFKGDYWTYKIYKSYNSNKFKSIFKTRDVYLDKNFKTNYLKFFKISSYIYELLFLLCLVICLLNIIILKKKEVKLLLISIIVFCSNYFILKNLLPNTGHLLEIGLSLNVVLLIVYLNLIKKLPKVFDVYFIIILPLALGGFLFTNLENIHSHGWWSLGDDWEWYQLLAREIVVDNTWINDDEQYTIRRYAIRLLVALYKIIFGKSFFPQLIFEIWAILMISFLTYKIGKINNLSKKFSLISGLLVLVFFFGDNFRWLIGRGLNEYYSSFFVILLAYLFCRFDTLNFRRIFLLSILGGFIIWLREDHAILVASLIFIKYKNHHDQRLNNLSFIKNAFARNFNHIGLYLVLLLFFTSLIFVKNYYSFGSLDSVNSVQSPIAGKIESYKNIFRSSEEHVEYYGEKNYWWHSLYRISFAADPGEPARITSIFLFGSIITTIFLLFSNRQKYFLSRPGILLIPVSIYVTYSLLNNGAYSPRYCISFLPFAIIICFLFFKKKLSIITQKRSFR